MTGPNGQIHVKTRSMRLCTHDRGDFASVRKENVLIYWPHGFGDLVGLGYVLPLLEPSNRYWITRFGDDYLSVMDGSEYVTPVFVGGPPAVLAGDGDSLRNRHLGLVYNDIDGGKRSVSLPLSIYEACRANNITTLLWTSYPETWGHRAYPYHSKARNLARYIAPRASAPVLESGIPLINGINFDIASWIVRWVEARLKNFAGFGGRKLCIIARNGYTCTGKNWGHRWREDLPPRQQREAEECRQFMRLLLKKDRRWIFLSMEDRLFDGDHTVRSKATNCFSYAELFGTASHDSIPFGIIMKALVKLASLSIGVPTGPFHLSMAKRDLPTVGIWIQHSPVWYDEPKECSIHLLGSEAGKGPHCAPESISGSNGLSHRTLIQDSRIITGEQALGAVETLLY
jgi:hypothetical protein